MVKVDEYQDTTTTQLEICHLSKSGLSETELTLSRAGHFDVTKDQVEQMVIAHNIGINSENFGGHLVLASIHRTVDQERSIVTKGMQLVLRLRRTYM